VVTAIWR